MKRKEEMEELAEHPDDGKQEWDLTAELMRTPVQLQVALKFNVSLTCSQGLGELTDVVQQKCVKYFNT